MKMCQQMFCVNAFTEKKLALAILIKAKSLAIKLITVFSHGLEGRGYNTSIM